MTTLVYGDPHSEWRPLLSAARGLGRGDSIILVGDCDLDRPLREVLAPVFAADIRVLWIQGNHDAGRETWYDNLFGSHPGGCIHTRPVLCDGNLVVGYGGVFREAVWWPKDDLAEPVHPSPDDFLRRACRKQSM